LTEIKNNTFYFKFLHLCDTTDILLKNATFEYSFFGYSNISIQERMAKNKNKAS